MPKVGRDFSFTFIENGFVKSKQKIVIKMKCVAICRTGSTCQNEGIEHPGGIRCSTHWKKFRPLISFHGVEKAQEMIGEIVTETIAEATIPEVTSKIAALQKENDQLKKKILRMEFDSYGMDLCEYAWHLGCSDDVVRDWWQEAFEEGGRKGLYKSLKASSRECKIKNCEECYDILAEFS